MKLKALFAAFALLLSVIVSAAYAGTSITYGGQVVNIQPSDMVVFCKQSQGQPQTVYLPPNPGPGMTVSISDASGQAATEPITIIPFNGVGTINGQPTYVLNINYGSVVASFTGASWTIVSGGSSSGGGGSSVTFPITIGQGGTGATTASAALSALGAASAGANSTITSLSGLTTPLSVGQGGTGLSTMGASFPAVLYASGASTIVPLAPGTANYILAMNSGGNGLTWVANSGGPSLPVSVANGGTGTSYGAGLSGEAGVTVVSGSGTLTATSADIQDCGDHSYILTLPLASSCPGKNFLGWCRNGVSQFLCSGSDQIQNFAGNTYTNASFGTGDQFGAGAVGSWKQIVSDGTTWWDIRNGIDYDGSNIGYTSVTGVQGRMVGPAFSPMPTTFAQTGTISGATFMPITSFSGVANVNLPAITQNGQVVITGFPGINSSSNALTVTANGTDLILNGPGNALTTYTFNTSNNQSQMLMLIGLTTATTGFGVGTWIPVSQSLPLGFVPFETYESQTFSGSTSISVNTPENIICTTSTTATITLPAAAPNLNYTVFNTGTGTVTVTDVNSQVSKTLVAGHSGIFKPIDVSGTATWFCVAAN